MGGDLTILSPLEARSALGWWLDMGVDAPIQEQSREWLRPPVTSQAAARPPAAIAPEPEPNIKIPDPDTLEALKDWLATGAEPIPSRGSGRRVMPKGEVEAEIMLLSEAPGASDVDQPIGGGEWQLAVRMLAAIGFNPDQAYSASLSCVHAPGRKMSPQERELCADIARRHIRLARPKRLLLLGDGPCQALLGKPLASARGHAAKVEGITAVATFHPRHLIHRPLDKSLAWKDLLLLMELAP